ncbi:RICIN domain-containing protein [Thermobifida halotolerans]|uniref:RICIN domain-containing protein n=2 Tax=Thermobifida halotolerans TaxID=483545 RepID=A0A399G2G5_9ACTN|nr:RICIN domain-containing protein [Thermobifida halotolerans]
MALTALAAVAQSAAAATIDTDAYYVLVNRHSGKAMDVWEWSTDNGGEIRQYDNLGGHNQQFRFVSAGDGYYVLVNRHSGKAVDVWEHSTADGAEIRQYDVTHGHNQQFRVVDSAGGDVRLINRNSGKALEVWEWSTDNGARLSQYTDHDGANQRWQLVKADTNVGTPDPGGEVPLDGLVGWATQNGGTTGGQGGTTINVDTASELISAMQASGPRVIRVSGTIDLDGMNDVASDKTLIGVGSDATITGGGLDLSGVENVIIRNINFRGWDDDAINIQEGSTNIWVDHNSFTDGYDGAVDIKRESDFITVSWNHVHNHRKSMLLGHSDSHTEDIGHLRVTYHHNFFDGSYSRHPRVRFGNPVHVFNNYYVGNDYGVASTENAGVLVEGNYFDNVQDPTLVGYGSSDDGNLVERNNVYANGSGTPESAGSVAAIPYSYTLDNPNNIPNIVSNGAGTGKI